MCWFDFRPKPSQTPVSLGFMSKTKTSDIIFTLIDKNPVKILDPTPNVKNHYLQWLFQIPFSVSTPTVCFSHQIDVLSI